MGFKENLRSELTYHALSVAKLAKKTGLSKRTLDNYLRTPPAQPTAENAVKIARALGVTVEQLVDGQPREDRGGETAFSFSFGNEDSSVNRELLSHFPKGLAHGCYCTAQENRITIDTSDLSESQMSAITTILKAFGGESEPAKSGA